MNSKTRSREQQQKKYKAMKEYHHNESLIQVGETAPENWGLIDTSSPEWWWFHLKSFPSAHVVLQKNDITEDDLIVAANHCKMATKYRNLKNVKVSYCRIKNLKKTDKVGAVTYLSKRQVKEIKI